MKREGYIFATILFGVLIYQQRKIYHISALLETVSEISWRLLEESYQQNVDEEFEMIVERLEDLD